MAGGVADCIGHIAQTDRTGEMRVDERDDALDERPILLPIFTVAFCQLHASLYLTEQGVAVR